MKKFKKIIAMGCAAIMACSVMSISAFAEIVTPLPGGGEFVIYEEGDEIPTGSLKRTADFTFNQTFPKYPSHAQLITPYTVGGVNNVVPLSSGERNILFHFDDAPNNCYVWLYNVDTGNYELNGASMGLYASEDYGFRNMPAGTTYKFRFSGTPLSSVNLSGSCETYWCFWG